MAKLRLGIADLLDSRPLAWGFLKGHYSDFFDPVFHPPGRVASLLASGEIDAGLVPSIELAGLPGTRVVADVGIAVSGRADTALLLHRVAPERIQRVAVDRNSRSERVLLEIILREKYGVEAEIVEKSSVEGWVDDCDASMLIAQWALRAQWDSAQVVSLTEAWDQLYGLPFVLALWAVRDEVRLPDVDYYFKSSLRYGLSSMDALQREAGVESDVRINRVKRYLGEQLRFVLTPDDRLGLEKLFEVSERLGLINEIPSLRYL